VRRPVASPARILPIALVAFLAQASLGCTAPDHGKQVATALSVEGTHWTLVEVAGESVNIPEPGQKAFFQLSPLDHRVTGYSGCNQMNGGYRLDGSSLEFLPIAMTRKYCQATASIEQGFTAALSATNGYRISGSTLELLGEGKPLAKLDGRQAVP